MKNHSFALFSFFLFLLPISLLGQELADYAPKTPEAMAMDKFVDIPPGSYTGVAGYSIPLYNISVDGYSIPITLNYHGMGVKVMDVASSAGLGWSISVGGISLSQQIMGANDFDVPQMDIGTAESENNNGGSEFDPNYPSITNADYVTAMAFYGNSGELSPDYYSYSLLHNSGKFILDNQWVAQTIPKQDVEIINSPQNLPTVLFDNQGIEYRFKAQLESVSVSGTSSNQSLSGSSIPSFVIEQIKFPSGKTIDFTYTNSVHDYIANHTETKSLYNINPLLTTNSGFNGSACAPQNFTVSRTIYGMVEELLSEITYDNAKISFTYSDDREDIGGKRLNNFKVQSLIGTTVKDVKNYNLSTSYWHDTLPFDIDLTSSNPYYNGVVKRLRLDSIRETLSAKSYEFEYYNLYKLPHRLSKSTDFWGLYNGKKNTSYIHQYAYFDANSDKRVSKGADKTPIPVYAQTASLKRIKLPTGGYQEFEYELDDYKFDATENLFYADSQQVTVTSTALNATSAVETPLTVSNPDYRDGFDYRFQFYWNNNPAGNSVPTNNNGQPNLPVGDYLVAYLLDGNNNEIQRLYYNQTVEIPPLDPNMNYKIRIERYGNAPGSGDTIFATLHWYQNNPQYIDNKEVGNLRIKSITLKQADGNTISLKRNYNYENPNDLGFSSGFFRDFPLHYSTEFPGSPDSTFPCRYENFSNNYDVNTGTFQGKSVVYEHVREEFVNLNTPSESYYTQRTFRLPDLTGIPQPNTLPKPPFVDTSYTGGLLLNSQAIRADGQKISETSNIYSFDNHFNVESYNNGLGGVASNAVSGGMLITPISYGANVGDSKTLWNWNYFFYPSTWVKLQESTSKTYFDNNVVEQKVTYGYDDNSTTGLYRHIKPISETTHTSSGKETETVYQYPQELTSEPHVLDLIIANRIANPLITKNYRESAIGLLELSNTQRTEFEDWGNGILEPKTIQIAKDTEILKDRIEFHDYDNQGNPLELSKADGMHVIYVWGYNTTKPIAKIENATYTGMSSVLTNVINAAKTASNNDTDNCRTTNCKEQLLRNALETLRNRSEFSNAMVSTYTYDPLVGVTSMTDPKGYTMYYEYDEFNRLKQVKDQDGNILSKNDYNYGPQN